MAFFSGKRRPCAIRGSPVRAIFWAVQPLHRYAGSKAMKQRGQKNGKTDDGPDLLLIPKLNLCGGIGEVVNRPDPPNTIERHNPAVAAHPAGYAPMTATRQADARQRAAR